MKHRNFLLAGFALAIGMITTTMPASAAHGWRVVGTQQVDGFRDRDVVRLPGRQRFSHIRLCIYRGDVRFRDLGVRFANGHVRDIPLRSYFRAGTCTRAIDLPGHRRDIAAIVMKYGNVGRGRFGWSHRGHNERHNRWRYARPRVVIYAR